jgi:5-formyltetrahydrofolate cyclo-ligase
MNERDEHRRRLRRLRREVPPELARRAAQGIAHHLVKNGLLRRNRRVAVYLANDGEADLAPVVRYLWRRHGHCFLPVLAHDRMWFHPYRPDTPLVPNRFRIPEPRPDRGQRVHPRRLDLVLAPLVAFDRNGNRLGMGGGFYDRSFAFLRHRRHWRRPLLVGVAYGFQEVASLPARDWDVPLIAVVTESGLIRFKNPI